MHALVTGGGGFLGRYIVDELLARGDRVRVLGRRPYPDLEVLGVECVQADLTDSGAVSHACMEVDTVFHVAARAAMWGTYNDFYQANVKGTQNILQACDARGVQRLVYTSSPSVVFNMEDIENGDETLPYPRHYLANYPATKAIAEQHVLAANGVHNLATCSLRPHLIYGPRDPHIVPMLMTRAREGRLVQIGDGHNLVDVTYVGNAARAHLQAADQLTLDSPVAGQAYFVNDGKPVSLWGFVNTLLTQLGLPKVDKKISYGTAYRMAAILEVLHRALPFLGEPRLTRFLASNFAHSHYFSIEKAHDDFGYEPQVSADEAMGRTVAWFRTNEPAAGRAG